MTTAPSGLILAGMLAEDAFDLARWLEELGTEEVTPGWLIFGICAQVVIGGCLVAHLIASRRRRRMVIPPTLGYAGTIATLMLLVYAASRHDLVFMVGQFINALICIRLLMLIRKARDKAGVDDDSGFPLVDPDLAERDTTSGED